MSQIELLQKLPPKLTGFNAFVDGEAFCGEVTELEPPKFKLKTEDFQTGCMLMPTDIEYGLEKMESKFTLQSQGVNVDRHFGKRVMYSFRGSVKMPDGNTVSLIIEQTGLFKEMDMGGWKSSEKTEKKYVLGVDYIKYTLDGEVIMELDNFNGDWAVGGENRTQQRNNALGI